jgi:hypothetical protein
VVAEFTSVFDKVVHLTTEDIQYMNTKKRNREWVEEITAKINKVNTVIKKNRDVVCI